MALQNERKEIVIGNNRNKVVQDYMVEMWGTPPERSTFAFRPQLIKDRVSHEVCDSMLNQPVTTKEVQECIKELRNGAKKKRDVSCQAK